MIGYRPTPTARRRPIATAAAAPASNVPARRHRPDYWLVMISLSLLVIGLVVVYAISPALQASSGGKTNYVMHQMLAIGLSLLAFAVTSKVPLERWQQWQKPLIIAAVAATLLAIVMPVNPQYPAHRWVRLGGFSFQSVELVKFALVIWLAGFLARQRASGKIHNYGETLKPLLIILFVGGGLIALVQSDLGSAGVLVMMMIAAAFVSGLPMKKLMLVLAVIAIGVVLAVASTPYRRERLFAFMHPQADCQDAGYQACQALIAVGSGGFIGLGLGRSVQAYGYLPEAANDSIFAIYAEKFGFIGTIILLLLFAALFARMAKIAERAQDDTSRLMVVGVLTWLSVQAIINMGAMIGLLPLKGITLPLISYGGTSVVFMAAAIGLVFQVSRYTSFISPLEGRRGHLQGKSLRSGNRALRSQGEWR